MPSRRSPGQRAGLTRAAVLDAARQALADTGVDGLTMRGLAHRLGVAPNALYSHVGKKDALIDDVLDNVLADVLADVLAAGTTPAPPTPDRAASPGARPASTTARAGLRQIMTSTYDTLLRHPDLVPLYLARQGARGENAQRLGELMFDFLGAAGIRGPAAHEARRVLIVYTMGFAALTAGSTDPEAGTPLTADKIAANFASGLDWLLTGILAGPAEPADHCHSDDGDRGGPRRETPATAP